MFKPADPTLLLTDPWAVSPDGTRIACEGGEGRNDAGMLAGIYSFRSSDGGRVVRVNASPDRRSYPIACSPDGSKILFLRQIQQGDHYDGPMNLFVVNTDGTGLTRLNPPGTTSGLIDEPVVTTASWSPDGRRVALIASSGSFSATDNPRAVFVVAADGSHPRRISAWGNSWGAQWSPNGRWIAFTTAHPQAQDIFVEHPDDSNLAAVTSAAQGVFSFGPVWSPDSTRLLFVRSATNVDHTDLWTVRVDGSQEWVHDKVPTMDSTEFHAMFHEAATRGWDEDELRQLARMWAEESGASGAPPADVPMIRAVLRTF